jgi:hypothetical protein
MNVPDDLDGRFEFKQDGLANEYLSGSIAEAANL